MRSLLKAPLHPDCQPQGEATCAAELQAAEQDTFFFLKEHHCYLKKMTDRKTVIIQK